MDRKEKRRLIRDLFIFSWIPEKNTARTLLAFAVFSVMIHFLGFYLFQVVYPEPVRPDLKPDGITLLDPRNPDTKAFLERNYDRTVFLEPASVNSVSRVRLSDHAIRFVPTFAESRPTLKRSGDGSKDPDFLVPAPSLDQSIDDWNNPVQFSPNLIKRGISPHTILDDYLDRIPNLPELRVNFTVLPSGVPKDISVVGEVLQENKQILVDAIQSTLRFEPAPEDEPNDPGWMKFGAPEATKL